MEIEYALKKLLNSHSLKLRKCKLLATKEQIISFRKMFQKTKKLFSQDPKSCVFPILGVPIDDNQVEHKVFLCEVAVGSCIYANRVYAESFPTPPGFDSYVVNMNDSGCSKNKSQSRDGDADNYKEKNSFKENSFKEKNFNDGKKYDEDEIFNDDSLCPKIKSLVIESPLAQYNSLIDENAPIANFAYLIKIPQRILPIAEVDFTYDKKLDQSSKDKCDLCKKENAIMFCHAERASFCKKCDQQIHANEFTMRHKRLYHKEIGKKVFMNCGIHSENVVEFFCIECRIPVCTQCRICGNHAQSSHKLISYLDACEILREKIQSMNEVRVSNCRVDKNGVSSARVENTSNNKVNPSVNNNDGTSVMAVVNKNIDELKSAMFKFKTNVEHVLSKIESEYKRALRDLRHICMTQCQLYNAEMLKNLKVKNEINLLKSFLDNVDDISIVRDFRLIEGLKVVEGDGECLYKDVSLRMRGELFVERVRFQRDSVGDEGARDVSMDAYIESKEK